MPAGLCNTDHERGNKGLWQKNQGFGSADVLMTGIETRTSAPVRIVRKETMECENVDNLYPSVRVLVMQK